MTNEKNNENYEVLKLNIKQVLTESIGIYKSGFKAFIMLSAITFILNISLEVTDYKNNLPIYIKLLSFIIMILSIYISSRINMSMYILSEKLSRGVKKLAKEAFVETKGLFWEYISAGIQYIFVLVLPIIVIYVTYRNTESAILKYIVITILIIPLIYLSIKYYFTIISATLKKEKIEYLKNSRLLVAGDFWAILILITISYLIFRLPYNIYTLFDYNMIALNKFIIFSINEFLFIFISPFTHIVTTVMYLTLKKNKNID